ncbi:MAG: hypothetical protein SO053_00090 [Bifidobacterium animalis]|nr:hypothetical protein [Bifidobacterium animalis]MDY5039547.1 hypothetical protein [Bifidobacterium animalis]
MTGRVQRANSTREASTNPPRIQLRKKRQMPMQIRPFLRRKFDLSVQRVFDLQSSIPNLQSSICVKRDIYVRDLSLFTQLFALLMRLMQLMQLMMRNDPSA